VHKDQLDLLVLVAPQDLLVLKEPLDQQDQLDLKEQLGLLVAKVQQARRDLKEQLGLLVAKVLLVLLVRRVLLGLQAVKVLQVRRDRLDSQDHKVQQDHKELLVLLDL
jgi:hypothetical protein